MARILALESSAELCSVAVLDNERVLERTERAPRQHAQLILPFVEELLDQAALSLNQLDAIAFGCGPGSFTGLRIAAGFAQGLAFGAQKTVIPVSNLRALAFSAAKIHGAGHYLACIDARMDEVYWAGYSVVIDRDIPVLKCVSKEQVSPPEQLKPHELNTNLVAVGSGLAFATRFPSDVRERLAITDDSLYVSAKTLAELAASDFENGLALKPAEAQPSYIRDEVAWKKLPGR
ncbi:MAG: tRNA (adenosine(37)-N6)-threonylcarbamoyltransferase complex dimerization subunit type 1 TsaB [Oleiphilaceae bacterium]|nr:tRNA (adenosine(37)-N6)-threonylcarbamoyltransferase complex dimerization subunit type 1 TsaB [Oleiphilaceae bacterium]